MLTEVTQVLQNWRKTLSLKIPLEEVYLFGSIINEGGKYFSKSKSDIDLIIPIPKEVTNAVQRFNWIETLSIEKVKLEYELIQLLQRNSTTESIVSIVTPTIYELNSNVHKSSVRDFFSENIFYNIELETSDLGINTSYENIKIDDLIRQVFEFVQSIRNKYLAISVVQIKHPLDWESDTHPLPKDILRNTALLEFQEGGKTKLEEKTSIKMGLAKLQNYLYLRRTEDIMYGDLFELISKRTIKMGEITNVSPSNYLCFAEVIFDMAQALIVDTPKKKTKGNKTVKVKDQDYSKSLLAKFTINPNGLIGGTRAEILRNIKNATLNFTWQTEPLFEISLLERELLIQDLQSDIKNVSVIDKLRKLDLLSESIIIGYKYILYYQNLLFEDSNDKTPHVLTCMRSFTLMRYNNVLSKKNSPNSSSGFLRAYMIDYTIEAGWFKFFSFRPIISFGLSPRELDIYLTSLGNILNHNSKLSENQNNTIKTEDILGNNILLLAANNQPLSSLNSSIRAQFITHILIDKLVRIKIDPLTNIKEERDFISKVVNIHNWNFGVA